MNRDELTEKGRELLDLADAMDALAEDLRAADSIADDTPALSGLFHAVRTSSRRAHDGRYVALLDHDPEDGWVCADVSWLESGTHYLDPNADEVIAHRPYPFLGVDQFGEKIAADLEHDARAARQNADLHREEPQGWL